MVTVHYVMTFLDGEVGDDTRKRAPPSRSPSARASSSPSSRRARGPREVGEKKTFVLDVDGGFVRERKEEAVQKLPATPEELEQLKEQVQPGQMVQLPNGATALCVSLDEDRDGSTRTTRSQGGTSPVAIELLEVSSGPEPLRGADRSFRREQGHREQVRSRARGGACVWWGGL